MVVRSKVSLLGRFLQVASAFIIGNLFYFYSRTLSKQPSSSYTYIITNNKQLRGFNTPELNGMSKRSFQRQDNTHLIIVPGHAVVKLDDISHALDSDHAWHLLSYQMHQDFPIIIASHIRKGIDLTLADGNATLVFSGGETRHDVGPLSEAASYYYVALHNEWFPHGFADRVLLEEFARDSYENLLFSLCRFKEVNGDYPSKVTVVGFDFKELRYTQLHRLAMRFPIEAFKYDGIRPPNGFDYKRAVGGEAEAYQQFFSDMYACSTVALQKKREERNPFSRTIPYSLSSPELADLLDWCGPEIFDGKLPWSLDSRPERAEYSAIQSHSEQ